MCCGVAGVAVVSENALSTVKKNGGLHRETGDELWDFEIPCFQTNPSKTSEAITTLENPICKYL